MRGARHQAGHARQPKRFRSHDPLGKQFLAGAREPAAERPADEQGGGEDATCAHGAEREAGGHESREGERNQVPRLAVGDDPNVQGLVTVAPQVGAEGDIQYAHHQCGDGDLHPPTAPSAQEVSRLVRHTRVQRRHHPRGDAQGAVEQKLPRRSDAILARDGNDRGGAEHRA